MPLLLLVLCFRVPLGVPALEGVCHEDEGAKANQSCGPPGLCGWDARSSGPAWGEEIEYFGSFSGYKLNWGKRSSFFLNQSSSLVVYIRV